MAVTYNVYKDSVQVATGLTAKTYDFTGLTADTQYTLGVSAVEGGVESVTATVQVTTSAALRSIPVEASQKTMSISDGEPREASFKSDGEVEVTSSDESVAVFVDGMIIPKGKGKAVIKGSTETDSAEINVTVK